MNFLFEVSWEVCNKVGGIYTAIRSKAPYAIREYGDAYFAIGPRLDENPEFKETNEEGFQRIKSALESRNLKCKLGRWKIEGEPRTILVDFRGHHEASKLLYNYWRDFGVDSYGAVEDYTEPVLFSTVCGEVIEAIYSAIAQDGDSGVAHFHKWGTGAGVLYLKKNKPEIGTVFTVHATALGRAMASRGRNLHQELQTINPFEEARAYNVMAKHYLETATAREADCVTAVSTISADEVSNLLGRAPDYVVENGLNVTTLPDLAADRSQPQQTRAFLHEFAQGFLQKQLPPETRFWITGGRYEFHNKGFDVLLESLSRLDAELRQQRDATPIVMLLFIATAHQGVRAAVHRRVHGETEAWGDGDIGIATHRLQDERNDTVVKACERLRLRNTPESMVHVIYAPAYLDGYDGLFNVPYEQLLAACDLGIFPSFYESWGYTPLESIAHAVPAITSDTAGFGAWVAANIEGSQRAVQVLKRRGRTQEEAVTALTSALREHLCLGAQDYPVLRAQAREIAMKADWSNFFGKCREAYDRAREKARRRSESSFPDEAFITFTDLHHSDTPRYRAFSVVSKEPKKIKGLLDLAYNLWWTWDPDAREMFAQLDHQLWIETDHNPVKVLNRISDELLQQKFNDQEFVKLYNKVLRSFQDYINDTACKVDLGGAITAEHPIAYFSMEYGMHECLPVYSGGLGVLSGDHLKSASDLGLPLFGVGLFYHQGYFTQSIDLSGWQRETYPIVDFSELPLKTLFNEDGSEAIVAVELPGRVLYARVWVLQVGRIKLYLMDSNIDRNDPEDRGLTSQLYGGDRRMRLHQEMLLGIGGTRIVTDILKIDPAVFHLNEGHVGFLLLERIRRFMSQGLNFQEARDKGGGMNKLLTVKLSHRPNPDLFDRGGYWEEPAESGKTQTVPVNSYGEASKVCQDYIRRNSLGGGNWTGLCNAAGWCVRARR